MKSVSSIGLQLWGPLNEAHICCADRWLDASKKVARFNRKRRKNARLSDVEAAQRATLYAELDSASSGLMEAAFAMVPYLYERKRYPDPKPGVPKRLSDSATPLPLDLDPMDTLGTLLGSYSDRSVSANRARARFEREHRSDVLNPESSAVAQREMLETEVDVTSRQLLRLARALMPYHYAKLPAIDVTSAAP